MHAPATAVALSFLLLASMAGLIMPFEASAAEPITELPRQEQVVLLHGLARSSSSMNKMAKALSNRGYAVCNLDYPSRHHSVEVLATDYVAPAIRDCIKHPQQPVHFVTHSLGGIIVRQLIASGALEDMQLGRVVMLGPPNGGSQVVDKLGDWRLFKAINGPAGDQLGTADSALPQKLGKANFELGIIAGNSSINPLLSLLIPGDDDGKVSIESAQLEGMQDFLIVPVSHPFLMKNKAVIEQTHTFLSHGKFLHDDQASR